MKKIRNNGMAKRLFSAVLALVMVLSLMPMTSLKAYAAAPAQLGSSDTYWKLEDRTLTISGTGAMPNIATESLPWYRTNGAVNERWSIQNVVIEDGVTAVNNLGLYFFDRVEHVVLGKDVASIGDEVFKECGMLRQMVINAPTPPALGKDVFKWDYDLVQILVPKGSAAAYKAAEDWSIVAAGVAEPTPALSAYSLVVPANVSAPDGSTATHPFPTGGERGSDYNLPAGWYVVDGDVTLGSPEERIHRVEFNGEANLILNGNLTIWAGYSGIEFENLTVWATNSSYKLKIDAEGMCTSANNASGYAPLILNSGEIEGICTGEWESAIHGTITVNGGKLTARAEGEESTAISCNSLTVNGGKVEASGYYGFSAYEEGSYSFNGGTTVFSGTEQAVRKVAWEDDPSITVGNGLKVQAGADADTAAEITLSAGREWLDELAPESGAPKYVKITHDHSFTYSVSGGTLTATCGTPGCDLANNQVAVTLTADDAVYTGSAYSGAAFTEESKWTDADLDLPELKYYEEEDELASVPTDVGSYTVKACPDWDNATNDNTVSLAFSITKKAWDDAPNVIVSDFGKGTYSDTGDGRIRNSADIVGSGVTYYYNTEDKNEGGTVWTADAVNQLDEGVYYAYAEFAQSANMDAAITETAEFIVLHNHELTIVTGKYADTDTADTAIIGTCELGDNYQVKATFSAPDMVFSGSAYDQCSIVNQAEFEKNTHNTIEIVYYDSNNQPLENAPVDAGTYFAGIRVGTNEVTKSFHITKKMVNAPTAGTGSYTYSGGTKTYAFASYGDSAFYDVTGDRQVDAGDHTVTAALKDKDNTVWADNTTDDKTFTFTIDRYTVPKPLGDPRTFVYNGQDQEFLVYNIIGDNAYNLMNVFYKLTSDSKSNIQKELGSYQITVEPMSNFKWEDGTTTPISFTYEIKNKQMYAMLYYFKDKRTGSVVDGYISDYYYMDKANPQNLKVSTFYEPYIYGAPAGSKSTVYVMKGSERIPWEKLTFSDLAFNKTYTVYAEITCDGYENYKTSCPLKIYRNDVSVLMMNSYNVQVTEVEFHSVGLPSDGVWGVIPVGYPSKTTRNKLVTESLWQRGFANLEFAEEIIRNFKSGKATYADVFTNDGLFRIKKDQMNKFAKDFGININALRLLSLSLDTVPEGAVLIDDLYFKHAAKLVEVQQIQTGGIDSEKLEEYRLEDTTCKVTFDLGYLENVPNDVATVEQAVEYFKKHEETYNIGDLITYVPTREGFTFEGWYMEKISEENQSPDGAILDYDTDVVKWDLENDKVYSDITLAAKWSSNQHDWQYFVDENNPGKLKVVCVAEVHKNDYACTHGTFLTLNVSNAGYSDNAVTASFGTNEAFIWEIVMGGEAPAITYAAKTGSELTEGMAVNAGSYTAKVTAGGVTATKDFTINKAASSVSDVPTAKTGLVYNGSAQDLVNAGTNVVGGTLQYSLSQNGEYSTTIPTGTNAGSYTVWYKVVGDVNHNDTTAVQVNVTIANANMNVTANGVDTIYDGTAKSISVTGAPDGAVIKYSTDGETYSTTNPTFTNVGEYTVYYKVTCANYNEETGSKTVKIDKKTVTVSGITAANKTYDGATAAALVCTDAQFEGKVDGDTLTITAAGTFADANVGTGKTVTISGLTLGGTSAGNYKLAESGNQTGTTADITAKDITVTITPNGGTYGSVTAASAVLNGLIDGDTATQAALTYTKDTAYNSAAVPTNAGTYTVTATISNSNYNLTGTTSASFVINPKSLNDGMLTLAPNEYTYGGDSKQPAVTVKDGETTLTKDTDYTVSGDESATNSGEYTITVTGAGNYTGTAQQTWNVNKAYMNLTVNGVDTIYDGTEKSISVTGAPAGATIQYSTDGETYSETNPTFTDAGEYTVYYKVTCANYNDATGNKTVKIDPKTVYVFDIAAENKAYDGDTEATLDYTNATFDGKVDGDTLTVTATGTFADANVGSEQEVAISGLTLGGTSAGNYELAESGNQTSTTADITAKDITVTITPNGGIYAGTITAAAAELGGVVGEDDVTAVITYTGNEYDSTTAPTNAGLYTVTVTISGEQVENYNLTGTTTADFVVGKASVTAPTADNTPFVYNTEEQTYTIAASELYTVTGDKRTVAGSQTVTVALKDKDNYKWADSNDTKDKTFTFEIAKAQVEAPEADETEFVYNTEEQTYAIAENELYTVTGDKRTEHGSQTVTVSLNDKENYVWADTEDAEDKTFTFEIAKADAGISATLEHSKTYGDAAFELNASAVTGAELTYSVEGDAVAVDEDGNVTVLKAGTATITVAAEETENYLAGSKEIIVTVAKKQGTLTISNVTYEVTYGDEGFAIGSIVSEGDKDSPVTFTGYDEKVITVDEAGNVIIVGAGETSVKVARANGENYLASEVIVTVKVAPKAVTVTAENKEIVFGDKDAELTYKTTELVGKDTLAINIAREKGTDAGEYKITASQEKGANANYKVTFVDGTYTVKAKSIDDAVVILDNALTANGKTQTQKVASVTLDGEKIDCDITGNTGKDAGTYTLTVTGKGNYTGTVTKTFVILPAPESKPETNADGAVVVGDGSIDVVSKGANVATDKASVIASIPEEVLNAEVLSAIASTGADMDIVLNAEVFEPSAADKELVAKKLNGNTVGQYLDVTLSMAVNGENVGKLTKLEEPISITVKLADDLIQTNPEVKRSYSVIRVHDGEVEVLKAAFDAETKTLTFKTDRFSTYTVVYKDTDPAKSPATGMGMAMMAGFLLVSTIAAAAYVLLASKRRSKYAR